MKSFSDNIVEKEQLPKSHTGLIIGLLIANVVLQIVAAVLLYFTLSQPVYLEVDHTAQPKTETTT
jgi:riboflavin transporter FmnP